MGVPFMCANRLKGGVRPKLFRQTASIRASAQAWKKALKKVEDRWRNELNGKPHLGKIFGLSGKGGNVKAFSKEVACKVYTNEQKRKFAEARKKWDPKGLFAAGLGMKLVSAC